MRNFKHLLFLVSVLLFGFVSCEIEDVITVTACFDISTSDYIAGEEISFTNCSSGALAYVWDFGDGNSSTDVTPTHTYSQGGDFTITMIASNGSYTDTYSKTIYVEDMDKIVSFNNNTPSTVTVFYADETLTESNVASAYDGYVSIYSGYNSTIDYSDLNTDNIYYFVITPIQEYAPFSYLYWTGSVSNGETKDIDVSSDFYHLTVSNEGYSTITGPEVFGYYGNGNDILDYNYYSYQKSISIGYEYEFGYYYQGDDYYAIGFWYTSSNYIFWNSLSFTDENCAIHLTNYSYKSNRFEAKTTSSKAKEGADCNSKVGTLSKEELAKLPID